jgi:hypothetical protein
VADSVAAIQRTQPDRRFKIIEFAHGSADLHPVAVARDRYSSRVVSPVLQASKTLKDDRDCRFFSNVANDAAHRPSWLVYLQYPVVM